MVTQVMCMYNIFLIFHFDIKFGYQFNTVFQIYIISCSRIDDQLNTQIMSKAKRRQQANYEQWSEFENRCYFSYMLMHLPAFTTPGRKAGKFVDMSHFIKTKDSDQCRSHHQKMVKQSNVEEDLRRYIMIEYEQRLLDVEQIVRELTHFLTKVNRNYLKVEMISAKMKVIRENWKKVMAGREEPADQNRPIDDLDSPTRDNNSNIGLNNLSNVEQWLGVDFCLYLEDYSFCASH